MIAATRQGHACAVCGRRISAAGLTITNGSSGVLYMTCVIGTTSLRPKPGSRGTP